MRDATSTIAMLRRGFAAIDNVKSVGGQIRAASPHAVLRAIERGPTRSRGMQCRPRAVRPTYAVVETLSTASAKWLAERVEPRLKPKTVKSYAFAMRCLVEHVGDVPIDALMQPQIAEALAAAPVGSRPARFSAWSSFFRWRGRPDLVAEIDRPQTARREAVLDVDDVRHFIAALGMARSVRGRKWACRTIVDLILFALLVPMREEEICKLMWEHVDLGSRIASLPDSKTGPRRVPLGRLGASILADRPRTSEWIFPISRPRASVLPHVCGTTVSTACKRILTRYTAATGHCWQKGTTFHTLRHSHASHALTMGVSQENVRHICGWSSSWIVDRYSHILSDAGGAMDKIQARLTAGLRMQLSIVTS